MNTTNGGKRSILQTIGLDVGHIIWLLLIIGGFFTQYLVFKTHQTDFEANTLETLKEIKTSVTDIKTRLVGLEKDAVRVSTQLSYIEGNVNLLRSGYYHIIEETHIKPMQETDHKRDFFSKSNKQ